MITSVTIENFRGVREGGVDGLAPISILVGPNNTGKSTALEAIASACMGKRADRVAELLLRRGGPPLDALQQIVTRGAEKARIEVQDSTSTRWSTELITPGHQERQQHNVAREGGLTDPMSSFAAGGAVLWIDAEGRRAGVFSNPTLRLAVRPEEMKEAIVTRFVDVDAVRSAGALEDAYTEIDRSGRIDIVVRALRRAMAGLRDLRILKSRDKFILHAFYESGPPVPVFLAGDGLKRILVVAAALLADPKGVLLLEEPESFQHPRYLEELATMIHLAAQDGSQVIVSTHSIELIDMLLRAARDDQAYPAVHRMSLYEGKLRATTLDRERAVDARESLYTDLRA